MRLATALFLAAVLMLAGCATASNYPPVPVAGQADTARFKVYIRSGVPTSHTDKVIAPELDAYRTANGYRSYEVLDRRWNAFPEFYEYTVRFAR